MKIALECQSLLLQDSLHRYLSGYLCNIEDCDFIISDHLKIASRPIYFLSFAQKTLPFVPETLLENLKTFHQKISQTSHLSAQPKHKEQELEQEIQALLMEFSDRFLQILRKGK